METNYPFNSFIINGREVTLGSILSNSEPPLSEFENHTFSFIHVWLTNTKNFNITTSGSTGKPKVISVRREQLVASATMTIKALGLAENDTALICLPTNFIAGRMMLVRAFVGGMKINAVEPSSNPLTSISSTIDFTALVPLQLQTLLEGGLHYKQQLNQMKAILVGGAIVNGGLQNEIKKIESPVYATYGMTETLSHVALQRLNGIDANPDFTPLPGVKISIDERGCLEIQTPYLHERVSTNDLVEIAPDNTFKWLGRWDNVINSGGLKIIPESLELKIRDLLNEATLNYNFFIAGMPDAKLGHKVVLVLEASNIPQKENLLTLLKEMFSKHEVPKDIIVIPKFIYTDTGKINREKTLKLA